MKKRRREPRKRRRRVPRFLNARIAERRDIPYLDVGRRRKKIRKSEEGQRRW